MTYSRTMVVGLGVLMGFTAADPPRVMPTGEITGATDGQGKLRVALSWRDALNARRNLDFIAAPSLDVAARDGSAVLFAAGEGAPATSRPINAGFVFSVLQWESPTSRTRRSAQLKAVDDVIAAQAKFCIAACAGETTAADKPFCDAYAKDPERDAILGALAAVEQRLHEARWRAAAKELPKPTPAEIEADVKLIDRVLAFHRSASVKESGRRDTADSTNPAHLAVVRAWRDHLAPPPGAPATQPDKDVPVAEAGLKAAKAVVRSIVRVDDTALETVTEAKLCPAGQLAATEATEKTTYAAWAREPMIVSLGLRVGFHKLGWYEQDGDVLASKQGRAVPVHLVVSFGRLIPVGTEVRSVKTRIVEGVLGVGRGVTPSTQEIKWCSEAGQVAVEQAGQTVNVPATVCSSGVLGRPSTINRVFAGVFAGRVWTPSGAFKAEIGPSFEYRWRRDDPSARALDLALSVPLSLNLGDKVWQERLKYNGVVRLVPTMRASWRNEADKDSFAAPEVAFLLTLQLLGQRGFWGDALSWL